MSMALGAALAGQLFFNVQHDADRLTLMPVATLSHDCVCELVLNIQRSGLQGQSVSRQRTMVHLQANQPGKLGKMLFSLPIQGELRVDIILWDEAGKRLAKQWISSDHADDQEKNENR